MSRWLSHFMFYAVQPLNCPLSCHAACSHAWIDRQSKLSKERELLRNVRSVRSVAVFEIIWIIPSPLEGRGLALSKVLGIRSDPGSVSIILSKIEMEARCIFASHTLACWLTEQDLGSSCVALHCTVWELWLKSKKTWRRRSGAEEQISMMTHIACTRGRSRCGRYRT